MEVTAKLKLTLTYLRLTFMNNSQYFNPINESVYT